MKSVEAVGVTVSVTHLTFLFKYYSALLCIFTRTINDSSLANWEKILIRCHGIHHHTYKLLLLALNLDLYGWPPKSIPTTGPTNQ
jgi:hypothetical protein